MALVYVRLFRLFYGSVGIADTEKGLLQILVLLQQPLQDFRVIHRWI